MNSPKAVDLNAPSDAELIAAVRGGDQAAYGELFERHRDAATRLARQIAGSSDADDLVSEAFIKVLNVLSAGGGPDLAFRAYLLTAVRRLHVDKIRRTSKVTPTDELESLRPGRAVRRPCRAGVRERRRLEGLRVTARALAARLVARRGRRAEACRGRRPAGHVRQQRLRPGLPGA